MGVAGRIVSVAEEEVVVEAAVVVMEQSHSPGDNSLSFVQTLNFEKRNAIVSCSCVIDLLPTLN